MNICSTYEYSYDNGDKISTDERNGYDEYNYIDESCKCELPRNIRALIETEDWDENIVCCSDLGARGPIACEEGFK